MPGEKILSVGINFEVDNCKYVSFDSSMSLSEWEIVVFFPDISYYYEFTDNTFQGKPALAESFYSTIKEQLEHWKREILRAFNSNKTIIIVLNELQEIYVDSGERKYAEAGNERKVTRIFDSYSNYDAIPLKLNPVRLAGKSIRLAKNSKIISNYWNEFSALSEYKVIIREKLTSPLLLTEEGKIAGAYAQNKSTNGAIILLPFLNFYKNNSLGQKFIKSVIKIDRSLKPTPDLSDDISERATAMFDNRVKQSTRSFDKPIKQSAAIDDKPAKQFPGFVPDSPSTPGWAKDSLFELPGESRIKKELLQIELKIDRLQKEKVALRSKISHEGIYRQLLFEKEKALKNIVLMSLKLLGFESLKYHDTKSGIDWVFQSDEARFMIEAEGSDSEAIGIEKLRQLEMKILEDYSRENVDKIAKGILFGNAFRLQKLNKRNDYFTTKCVMAAKRNRVALVRTPDLFWVVKYLCGERDAAYAKKCRLVILQSEGEIVNFPEPPA